MRILIWILFLLGIVISAKAQTRNKKFTLADTMRGSITANRAWWNVLHYDIDIAPNISEKTLVANVSITFKIFEKNDIASKKMQVDLQEPLQIDSAFITNENKGIINKLQFKRDGNFYLISGFETLQDTNIIKIYYSGVPHAANRAPWDGGISWKTDVDNNPLVSVSCQGLGASVWYACKDHQSDEPEMGATITITTPDSLQGISNGRLLKTTKQNRILINKWEVKNPINNYGISFYIGKYAKLEHPYQGLNGQLDCTFYALQNDSAKAEKSFDDIHKMLKAFEHWFGPYPFYNDGYKLVQAPYLGMEHQSAIAYGNKFQKGYLGEDLSGTGLGLTWDYIIVHESGHEWWGNNVTTNDIADMWVHEGFTTYSESLFVEYYYGKEAGQKYVRGHRKNIENREPCIGNYDVNNEATSDIYYKGANILNMLRTIVNNDSLYFEMFKNIQNRFGKITCNSEAIESEMASFFKLDITSFFDQYLYNNTIPTLHYKIKKGKLSLILNGCNNDFKIPFRVFTNSTNATEVMLEKNKVITLPCSLKLKVFEKLLDQNYYFNYERY
jgi:aminopeptidase N